MGKQFLRFGPALLILLAALIYAATAIWQHSPVVPPKKNSEVSLESFRLEKRVTPAECDALWHYTPAISVPLYGIVGSVKQGVLKLRVENGVKELVLAPTTRIVALGKLKPPEVRTAQMTAFNELARPCNDGTRVYIAPGEREEISVSATALKAGTGVEVLLDETASPATPRAAIILLMRPIVR